MAPTGEVDEVIKYELGPPGPRSDFWPREMFTSQLQGEGEVFAVCDAEHQQYTFKFDGDLRARPIAPQGMPLPI